jgi:hypothetical protein
LEDQLFKQVPTFGVRSLSLFHESAEEATLGMRCPPGTDKGLSFIQPDCREDVNSERLHHLIHQLLLTMYLIEHRPLR